MHEITRLHGFLAHLNVHVRHLALQDVLVLHPLNREHLCSRWLLAFTRMALYCTLLIWHNSQLLFLAIQWLRRPCRQVWHTILLMQGDRLGKSIVMRRQYQTRPAMGMSEWWL